MKARRLRSALLSIAALSLAGCYVVTPRVVVAYDDECEIGFRKMVLTAEQFSGMEECLRHDCEAAVFGGILLTSASAIVSGSIVLVGNTVYWLQKQGRCERAESG